MNLAYASIYKFLKMDNPYAKFYKINWASKLMKQQN